MQYVAAAFGTAMLPEMVAGCSDAPVAGTSVASPFDFGTLPPPIWVVRPDDMVSLGVQLANLSLDANRNLIATNPNDAYVVLTFPGQHVVEDEFQPPGGPSATPYALSRIAGPSRVVFKVPAGFAAVPYSLHGILSLCAQSTSQVATNALSYAGTPPPGVTITMAPRLGLAGARVDRQLAAGSDGAARRAAQRVQTALGILPHPLPIATHVGTAPVAPQAGETALEIPHRLLVSPSELTAWCHAADPVVSPAQRVELWHSRLAMRDPVTGRADERLGGRTLRALWTRDYDIYNASHATSGLPPAGATASVGDPLPTGQPSTKPLPSADNRDHLVRDTGDQRGVRPNALAVSRLILSPFGATLDMKGEWPNDPGLLAYIHDIHLGRDEYVETAQAGWVLPFMNPATLLTVAKRNTDPNQGAVGTIYQWNVLLIGKPLVSYADGRDAATQDVLRQWPFAGVELLQTTIPCNVIGNKGWVYPLGQSSGPLLPVGARGVDAAGSNTNVRFTTPLYFVQGTDDATLAGAMSDWAKQPPTYTFDGQRIAYAPAQHDETSYETQSFVAQLAWPKSAQRTESNVVPAATQLALTVEAIRHLTPSANAASTFEYHATYTTYGFDPANNPNEALLQVTGAAPSIGLSTAAKSGGVSSSFVSPDMSISALSRKLGPLAGATAASSTGGFNPGEFFGDLPTLFGFLKLSDLLQKVDSGAAAFMPKCVTQALADAEHFVQQIDDLYQKAQAWAALAQQYANQVQRSIDDANAQLADIKARIAAGTPTATDLINQQTLTQLVSTLAPAQAAKIQAIQAALGNGTTTGVIADVKKLVADVEGGTLAQIIDPNGALGADLNALVAHTTALLTALQAQELASIVGGLQKDAVTTWNQVNAFLQQASTLGKELQQLASGLEMAKNLTVKLEWRPKLGGLINATGGMFRPVSDQGLYLQMEVRAKAVNGKQAGADVTCRLDQFVLGFGADQATIKSAGLDGVNKVVQQLAPSNGSNSTGSAALDQLIASFYLSLVFDHVQFQMLAGHKPDVDVAFKGIHFGGPLKFIETLRNLIPLDGFSDPPYVDVQSDHVEAGFNLALPNVAVGMFSLENVKLSAAIQIPLVGDKSQSLTFKFAFCSKDQPFLVTVAMLGGGGFFSMTMDPTGLVALEAQIEVCAQLSVDLGVASGCVSIEAGIYFAYTKNDGIEITGFLRLRGSVSVLGLITLSVELYMSLSYYEKTGKVIGHADIVVEVDVAFFSESVHITCERKFAGSNGDPTFQDLMQPATDAAGVSVVAYPALNAPQPAFDPFADYCVAFAAAA